MTQISREDSFRKRATRSLQEGLVEDGERHPLDYILKFLCQFHPEEGPVYIKRLAEDWHDKPVFLGCLLQCLGRVPFEIYPHYDLLQEGLKHSSLEVREGALCALEGRCFEDKRALTILKRHNDPDRYIDGYVKRVVKDFEDLLCKKE